MGLGVSASAPETLHQHFNPNFWVSDYRKFRRLSIVQGRANTPPGGHMAASRAAPRAGV
jgi:hypothetical protein